MKDASGKLHLTKLLHLRAKPPSFYAIRLSEATLTNGVGVDNIFTGTYNHETFSRG